MRPSPRTKPSELASFSIHPWSTWSRSSPTPKRTPYAAPWRPCFPNGCPHSTSPHPQPWINSNVLPGPGHPLPGIVPPSQCAMTWTFIYPTRRRRKDSPFWAFWKSQEGVLPELTAVARRILSIPAASTAAETIFRNAGNIFAAKRSGDEQERLDDLLYLMWHSRTWIFWLPYAGVFT